MADCTHTHRTQCAKCWDTARASSSDVLTDRTAQKMLQRRDQARLQIIAINRRDADTQRGAA